MKTVAVAGLLLCALPFGSMADKPKVTREAIRQAEESLDLKFKGLFAGDPVPVDVIGLTQGTYINGYGAVFQGELNLAIIAGITPFHPVITPDELKRMHDRKLARLPQLREAMRNMLVDTAASLTTVSPDDQLAMSVSLFYWKTENREGLPSQIVMHAPKKVLMQAKAVPAEKASIAIDEF